ncbi:MAG: TFIIB-type zinc ribbon-containing protein [Microbacteriaceae bacterium]|nr:TFIIB-type zinc ribbon-containing protein [Microbacteriaceae bacterium]
MRAGTGKLICAYCRHEWNEASVEEKFGLDSAISELRGTVLASGASNAPESTDDVVTLKCQACGAEVVINTDMALQGRCHWCRHTLSINQQMPNGAVPDGLLPFKITRDDAITRIDEFVKSRKFFAHPKFVKEFAPSEVVGVYMPYLTVDANAHVAYEGAGEELLRRYTVKRGDRTVTLYDADQYQLGRQFSIHIDDLMLESSAQRADIDTSRNTNNIINAIMPFDVKEAVAYNANYLRGFTSERRDLQVQGLSHEAANRMLSIGRSRAGELARKYDRGIRWESESIKVHGTRWVALYLPVWLYSYYERRGDREFIHYVAVNGRTGATLGSVPVRQGRLIGISTVIGIVGTIIGGALAILLM